MKKILKNMFSRLFTYFSLVYRKLEIKFPFLNKLALRLFYAPRLNKKILSLKKNDKNLILKSYYECIEKFVENIEIYGSDNNIYIYCAVAWAWDSSYRFLYLKYLLKYLDDLKNNIYLICDKKFFDVVKLYWKYFNIHFIPIKNPVIIPKTISDLPSYLIDIIKTNNWKFINSISIWIDDLDVFIACNSEYKSCYNSINFIGEKIKVRYNVLWEISIKYKYDNYSKVDFWKINNLLNNYSNDWWKIILCNFESKSLSCWNFDNIDFSWYIKKLNNMSKNKWLKFVINSVYNWELLYNDDSILVTRLNFQEIIWLAEHNKIDIFLSERNWLNDVFYVFYPKVKQIVYYPSNYIYFSDCTYFDKKYGVPEWFNVKNSDFWKLPDSESVIYQWQRRDFCLTIDKVFDFYF